MPAPAPGPHPLTATFVASSGAVRSASSLQQVDADTALLSAAMASVLPPSNMPSRRPSAASSNYSYNFQPSISADPFQQLALTTILPPSPARSRASSTSVPLSVKQPPPQITIHLGGNRSRSASLTTSVARGTPLPESPKLAATLTDMDAVPNATLPPALVIDMDACPTFETASEPWSNPLPQSPSSPFTSSYQNQQDASAALWTRDKPAIAREATVDIAAQLPLPMSRGGSFSHSLPSSSSRTRDWAHLAQHVQLPSSTSNLATVLQEVIVDLPLLQFDQAHRMPFPASNSILAPPAQIPPLPPSTSVLTAASDISSNTLQATPPPSNSSWSNRTFVHSGSFTPTTAVHTPAAHVHILPPSTSSLTSSPSQVAATVPLPPNASTLAPVQPHTVALPASVSRLQGDTLQPALVPLPLSTSDFAAPPTVQPSDPAAIALPASASNQPAANDQVDHIGADQDTWASKSRQHPSKPLLNDQVLVALRLSDPDLLSSCNDAPQEDDTCPPESLDRIDSSATSAAHSIPLPPSESRLVHVSTASTASLARLPKSGSLTPREPSASSRRLSHLSGTTSSTRSHSPTSSGSVTPTDASSSARLYHSSDQSHSPAASLIEIFDIFFVYASVTSSTPVKYRQDRLLSLLRAKLGPARMLLADITLPEFHKLRALAIEQVKAKGFKVPPWPVVVLQVRVVEGNASGASLAFKEEVDPTDADEVGAAWAAGDEEGEEGRCERTWIAHEEIEEAMEMGTLDELLQLDSEHEEEDAETQGEHDDGESEDQSESAEGRSDLGEEADGSK